MKPTPDNAKTPKAPEKVAPPAKGKEPASVPTPAFFLPTSPLARPVRLDELGVPRAKGGARTATHYRRAGDTLTLLGPNGKERGTVPAAAAEEAGILPPEPAPPAKG